MNRLDIKRMKNCKQILKIGELTEEIINILNINEKPRNIKFAYDRIQHCEKHKKEFKDNQSYEKSMEKIPLIINEPDYVGYNTKNNSIEYIKRLDDLTLVAIRIKTKGDLFLRSIYPISEVKLKNKIISKEYKDVKRGA